MAGDQLKLRDLQLLEGADGRRIRVIERVAPNWKDLAIAIGFDQSRIMIIDQDCRGSVEEACRAMFMRWLDEELRTWDMLIKCLRRAALVDVANSLKTILRQ